MIKSELDRISKVFDQNTHHNIYYKTNPLFTIKSDSLTLHIYVLKSVNKRVVTFSHPRAFNQNYISPKTGYYHCTATYTQTI